MKQVAICPDIFDPRKFIRIVEAVKGLKSKVTISAGSFDANAESYLELLSLWAEKKEEAIQITIEGEDEQCGIEKIEALFCE